jgi:hypothetical protein
VSELLPLLQDFYRERLEAFLRHQASARQIGQYDINNTYQYVIGREETQLSWVAAAITQLGGTLPEPCEPRDDHRAVSRAIDRAAAARAAIEEDARDAQAFVDRWRPRVDALANARDAKMLRIILGEALEHKRFFDQALAGRTDLLGRRGQVLGPSHGEVLSTRWIE